MRSVTRLAFPTVLLLPLLGCKTSVVLRDPVVYKNEIGFLQMALEQNVESLRHFLNETCSCDEGGQWKTVECEDAALNVVVIESRLQYHVDLMLYNARLLETRPPKEAPVIPEASTLCSKEL
jgi:hypothetical protein